MTTKRIKIGVPLAEFLKAALQPKVTTTYIYNDKKVLDSSVEAKRLRKASKMMDEAMQKLDEAMEVLKGGKE